MLTHRQTPSARLLRQVVVVCVLCLALYCLVRMPADSSRDTFPQTRHSSKKPRELPPELLNNRFLTEAQCAASFPGLTKEIDDVVARGPFTLKRNPHGMGPLIARIRDGKLSILSYARKSDLSRDTLQHRGATLHQIAAALLTSPSPLPDTIIAFNHGDEPLAQTWSYSRPADPSLNTDSDTSSGGQQHRYFPIPHFSFYSWPLPFIGSFARARAAIAAFEDRMSWGQKIPKAVWRGTAHFNAARAGRVRQNLLLATRIDTQIPLSDTPSQSQPHPQPQPDQPQPGTRKQKPWADVEALTWTSQGHNASNALAIEDFCAYRYVVHTEGISYSGRFQLHTLCASVVLTPPIAWMQHVTHLVRPLFSYTLPALSASDYPSHSGSDSGSDGDAWRKPAADSATLAPYPAPWVRGAWPHSYAPSEANIVFVAPDWSDLESTVAWLEAHPDVAEGIARRQRALFEGGGYLSPAAEMCYWRALIRGWASVARTGEDGEGEGEGQGWEDLEEGEVPWEEFSLTEMHK
ncbi:glycosyl transferase family 90-domain-containing protein [Whalleya microplaca]|nr:glycosyl transferase family 90-domain-containing protein [Whalleya microplaca]